MVAMSAGETTGRLAAVGDHNRYQREYYEYTDKRTLRPTGAPYIQRHVDRLIGAARLAPGHAILEVGCGRGKYTMPLLDRGFRLTALDLSPELLQHLRAAAVGRHLDLVLADAADADQHLGDRFDRVVGFFMLHHVHDLDLVFRGIARVLKPGGTIAFLEPVARNPLYYLQIAASPHMTWKAERGLINMRSSVVHQAMRRQRFVNCRTESFGLFPPMITNTSIGRYVEDVLQDRRATRLAHAFQIFSATLPA